MLAGQWSVAGWLWLRLCTNYLTDYSIRIKRVAKNRRQRLGEDAEELSEAEKETEIDRLGFGIGGRA